MLPVKFVLRAGLFANQQSQLAFAGAFATIATVALAISYFLRPSARVSVGLVLAGVLLAVSTTSGFGVVLALRSGEKVTIRTHPDWVPRSDDEDTKRLAEALQHLRPTGTGRGLADGKGG